ncbi:hypothetical protein TGARI_223915 [Toxoplasma gondii ARI]|uniref:Uncharacterized protein n=1 Tax=Toxoplasma gondii ARI TaxID=1074872 RepID=A0A139XTR9_TOXGO|nr:hypothetical protein TGARI_223915 [Toxoplasma gondii ARI]
MRYRPKTKHSNFASRRKTMDKRISTSRRTLVDTTLSSRKCLLDRLEKRLIELNGRLKSVIFRHDLPRGGDLTPAATHTDDPAVVEAENVAHTLRAQLIKLKGTSHNNDSDTGLPISKTGAEEVLEFLMKTLEREKRRKRELEITLQRDMKRLSEATSRLEASQRELHTVLSDIDLVNEENMQLHNEVKRGQSFQQSTRWCEV